MLGGQATCLGLGKNKVSLKRETLWEECSVLSQLQHLCLSSSPPVGLLLQLHHIPSALLWPADSAVLGPDGSFPLYPWQVQSRLYERTQLALPICDCSRSCKSALPQLRAGWTLPWSRLVPAGAHSILAAPLPRGWFSAGITNADARRCVQRSLFQNISPRFTVTGQFKKVSFNKAPHEQILRALRRVDSNRVTAIAALFRPGEEFCG